MISTSDVAPSSETFMDFLNKVKMHEDQRMFKLAHHASWHEWTMYQWNEGFLKQLIVWVVWMLAGTMYFGSVDFEGNYYKGFYYSVNVGYSVGWGVLKLKYRYSKIFASFYLFLGALFALHYVASLIKFALSESDNLYAQLKIRRNIEKTTRFKGWMRSVYVYMAMNSEKLFIIYVWFLFLFCGAAFTVCVVGWSWLDGFYYALTSMSTAGLEGIPYESPNYLFLVTGLMTAVGVPIMAMAVGNIGLLMVEWHQMARVEAIVDQQQSVTWKELVELVRLKEASSTGGAGTASGVSVLNPGASVSETPPGSVNGEVIIPRVSDVGVNRGEYIVASLVRMKVVDVDQIHDLLKKFDSIDVKNSGTIDMGYLTSDNCVGSPNRSPRRSLRSIIRQASDESDDMVGRLMKAGYHFLEDV